jgi:hypothetical protein
MGAAVKRPNVPVDEALWFAVLESMRRHPGNVLRASKATGSSEKTVRRLWTVGYPKRAWGVRPMKDVLLDENRAASARAAAATELAQGPDERAIAEGRRVAIETKGEEARLLRYARGNALGLMSAATKLTAAVLKLADRIALTLDADEKAEAGQRMTLFQALLTFNRAAGIIQKSVYVVESTASLERMVLGDPKERAGTNLDGEMTLDEAIEEIQTAADTAARLERRGLRILNGGKSPPLAVGRPLVGEQPAVSVPERPPLNGEGPHPASTSPRENEDGST